jgi:predicted amidohydrolase
VGGNHKLPTPYRPHNSLYVISADGLIHGRYDKRWCSHTEINDWYTPGTEALVFEVGGLRFGCALCIEIQFPMVFMDYLRRDVHCVLLSSYSDTPMFGIQAQGYAASHNFWFRLSVPAGMSKDLPSTLVGPSGEVVGQCRNLEQSLTVNTLDLAAPEWDVALNKARPWRARCARGRYLP